MLFVGKRGEHANVDSNFLGSNLEKVARGVTKPLFVSTVAFKPIEKLLIAYDGKNSTQKAVEFIANHPSLNHIECHLLAVRQSTDINLSPAVTTLRDAGFKVTPLHRTKQQHRKNHRRLRHQKPNQPTNHRRLQPLPPPQTTTRQYHRLPNPNLQSPDFII